MRHLTTTLILTLLTLTIQAQDITPVLYKVTGNGAKPSYIFGTCHTVDISFFDSIPGATKALSKVKKVMLEINQDTTGLKAMMSNDPNDPIIMMPADTTYEQLMSQADIHFMDSIFGQYAQQLYTRKPFGLATGLQFVKMAKRNQKIFTIPPSERRMDHGIDILADSMGLNRGFFETLKEQSELVKSIGELTFKAPLPTQAQVLHKTITAFDDTTSVTLNDIWQLSTMQYKAMCIRQETLIEAATMSEIKDLYTPEQKQYITDLMLKDRNLRWLPTIETEIKQQPTFIAVGFAHVIGPNNIVDLLRAKGYKVKPITK
ncbi:MAG: TraB/GumN family protein [Bacteroidaceae bacterium]|nr:TraB/GumN family protein [Bacteroidaceae bacterium]